MLIMNERLIIIAVMIAIITLLIIITNLRKIKIKRGKTPNQIANSISKTEAIIAAVEFSGTIRDTGFAEEISQTDACELSDVESITCQDSLGQELSFVRLNNLNDNSLYREVTYSTTDYLSRTIQMAMPAGQQLYTAASLAQIAPNGLFTATVNPAQLSRFVKDGTYMTTIHGPKGIISHAGFKKIPGFSGFNPVAIASIAFQAMAMISGNHYLHLINQRLTKIENSIQEIMVYHTDKDLGILTYAQRRLLEITNHSTVTDSDMEDIRDIKRDVGKLYDQYRFMFSQYKEAVEFYQAEREPVERRMNRFSEAVGKFAVTAKICVAAYQIYIHAVLTEILISMKRNAQKAELDNMINDAMHVSQMKIETPNTDYKWLLSKAQAILEEKYRLENLMGIDDNKKRQLLAPIKRSTNDLNEFAQNMRAIKTPERLLYYLQESKRTLLIPGENGSPPRVFVPA